MSDVCIKRKMRDRLLEDGQGIFVQSDDRKRDEFTSLKARAESVIDKKMTKQEIIKAACAKWFDVRAFGQLFALSLYSRRREEGFPELYRKVLRSTGMMDAADVAAISGADIADGDFWRAGLSVILDYSRRLESWL